MPIIFLVVLGLVMYVMVQKSYGRPIIPFLKKDSDNEQPVKYKKNNPKKSLKI